MANRMSNNTGGENEELAGVPDEPYRILDRFAADACDTRRAGQMNFVEHQGFEPSTLEYEKVAGGWIRTAAPEGVPLSQLPEIYTMGSRGAESKLTRNTVGRTTARRGMNRATNEPPGDDWSSGDDGDTEDSGPSGQSM